MVTGLGPPGGISGEGGLPAKPVSPSKLTEPYLVGKALEELGKLETNPEIPKLVELADYLFGDVVEDLMS